MVSFSLIYCSPVFFQVSTGIGMQWTCKFCTFVTPKRGQLLKHYRLKHGGFTRTSPIPCLYQQCVCTFKSFNALKVHLSRFHSQLASEKDYVQTFNCQVCEFKEPCTENEFFTHLRNHVKLMQKVQCPYLDCDFETNVYSTFNTHKKRNHDQKYSTSSLQFKPGIAGLLHGTEESTSVPAEDVTRLEEEDLTDADVSDLNSQLEHNLASLFLKMQTILNISESALQEIIQQIRQIFQLSEPLMFSVVEEILSRHYPDIDSAVVKEVVYAVTDTNVFLKHTSAGGSLQLKNFQWESNLHSKRISCCGTCGVCH